MRINIDCRIQWKESSTSSPDSFDMTAAIDSAQAGGGDPAPTSYACTAGFIYIPDLSPDGVSPLPVPIAVQAPTITLMTYVLPSLALPWKHD